MRSLLILGTIVCLVFAGCGTTTQVIPGVPAQTNITVTHYTVLNAEKLLEASNAAADFFLLQEKQNEAFVKANLPQVHAFAEKMRRDFNNVLIRADNALNAYKAHQTADNQTTLDSIMKAMESWLADIKANTAKIKGN